MKLAVCVIGDGRYDMLLDTVRSLKEYVAHPISARVMVNDEADPDYCARLEAEFPEWRIAHTGRVGMAGAVQAGFDLVLDADADYVLWLEEDHLLIRPLPIADAIGVLERNTDLAQMTFKREPCDPSEGVDQLDAILERSTFFASTDQFTMYDYLFSMIPNLIPKRVIKMGWPAGPLGVGNEAGMTARCAEAGYSFASWGHVGDEPYVRHIGYGARSSGWAL